MKKSFIGSKFPFFKKKWDIPFSLLVALFLSYMAIKHLNIGQTSLFCFFTNFNMSVRQAMQNKHRTSQFPYIF